MIPPFEPCPKRHRVLLNPIAKAWGAEENLLVATILMRRAKDSRQGKQAEQANDITAF